MPDTRTPVMYSLLALVRLTWFAGTNLSGCLLTTHIPAMYPVIFGLLAVGHHTCFLQGQVSGERPHTKHVTGVFWLVGLGHKNCFVCRAKFHETAAQHIRRQLQLLKAELPLPPESDDTLASMAAAGFGSHVLEDDQCEDEETEQPSTSLRPDCMLPLLYSPCRSMCYTDRTDAPC